MTDADTPRVPDNLYWSAYHNQVIDPRTLGLWGGRLPADAVKLGDVEAAYAAGRNDGEIFGRDAVYVKWEAEQRAIRDVLNDPTTVLVKLDRTRAILDREPGREEPPDTVWNGHERVSLAQWRANHEDEVFERLPDEGSLPQYRLREPGREEPKPRVFLPGDTVPAEVEVWTKDRAVYRWGTDRQLLPYEGAMVEVLYPSPAEWQAIVDRARAARGHVVEHQPDTEEADR